MAKIYGVYLAWAKWEVISKGDEGYEKLPNYPKDFSEIRLFDNKLSQLDAFSNIPCPASQTFEADSMEEVKSIIEDFKCKFENEEWLKENIYPYI